MPLGRAQLGSLALLFCKAVTQRVEDRCFCGTDLLERQAGCRKKN